RAAGFTARPGGLRVASGSGRPTGWSFAPLAPLGLLAGAVVAGVAFVTPAAQPPEPRTIAPPPRETFTADGGNKPLPPGAIARLGGPDLRLAFHVHSVAFSPDGRLVAGGSGGAPLTLWDRATGRVVRELAVPGTEGAELVAFTPDGRSLLAITYTLKSPREHMTTEVVLLDVQTGKLHWRETADGPFGSYAFAPDGKTLVAGCRVPGNKPGEIGLGVFDAATGRLIRIILSDAIPLASGFSTDGATVPAVCRDGTARVLDPATGRELRRVADLFPDWGTWTRIAVSPDGKTVALGGPTRVGPSGARPDAKEVPYTLQFIDMVVGKPVQAPDVRGEFNDLAFGPDGKTLAVSVEGRGL